MPEEQEKIPVALLQQEIMRILYSGKRSIGCRNKSVG